MGVRARLRDPKVARRLRIAALIALLVFALWLPFNLVPYRVFQFTLVLVYAIAVLGLGLLTGYNGQISLGHGAFFAVGAYTAAILMDKVGWAYPWTVLAAALVTFALGLGVGIPALRLHGLYLALVTLALAVVTPPILKRFTDLTGGSMGLSIRKPAPPEWTGLADDQWLYLLVLTVTAAVFLLAWNLVNSRVGRAMIAIRENPLAAETMGIELARVKTLTFAWSAMFAGVAGVLFVWVIGFVSPDSFTVLVSIEFLAAMVVGGLGTIWGALIGAAFILFVPNISQDISQAAPGIAFGGLLILVMYVAPGGIVGLGKRSWARLVGVPAPAAALDTPTGTVPEAAEPSGDDEQRPTVTASNPTDDEDAP